MPEETPTVPMPGPIPSPKPGYKTTEFWMSIAAHVIGIAVIAGGVTEVQGETMVSQGQVIAGALVNLAAAFGYNITRGMAKRPPVENPFIGR